MDKKIIIGSIIGVGVVLIGMASFYVEQQNTISLGSSFGENSNLTQDDTTSNATGEISEIKKDTAKVDKIIPVAPANLGFKNYGKASDFITNATWLNSEPLTLAELKGKVVLVDFWTYSCINCIRTLPYVTQWYEKYKDQGFVVVGVHTPEFAFEKDTENVKKAINQYDITYPVVQDNNYLQWSSYNNKYWPAHYLIDQEGNIVKEHFGEGEYDVMESAIQYLLGLETKSDMSDNSAFPDVRSPEMYFGTARLANLTGTQSAFAVNNNYTLDNNIQLNEFSLGGSWKFSSTSTQLQSTNGQINLKFHSGKLYMVASSENPAVLTVMVDGKPQPSVTVTDSKLYTLFDSTEYTDHAITIQIDGKGFEAFTFTFG